MLPFNFRTTSPIFNVCGAIKLKRFVHYDALLHGIHGRYVNFYRHGWNLKIHNVQYCDYL